MGRYFAPLILSLKYNKKSNYINHFRLLFIVPSTVKCNVIFLLTTVRNNATTRQLSHFTQWMVSYFTNKIILKNLFTNWKKIVLKLVATNLLNPFRMHIPNSIHRVSKIQQKRLGTLRFICNSVFKTAVCIHYEW